MRKMLMATLVVVAAIQFGFVDNASANNPGNGFQVSSAKATSTVKFSVDFNFIGTYVMHTKGLKKKNGKVVGCFTASGTWTNSVRTPVIKAYRETSKATFCPLNKPVTINGVRYTHVKTAGGKTGNPCWNLAIPPGKPQPKPQIKGPVLDVRSMANIEIPVKVKATANASVWGAMQCPGGAVGASASGSGAINGTIKVKISQSLLMSNRGQVNGPVRADIEQQIRTSVEGSAKADAVASISVSCGAATPPPNIPPPVCPPGTMGTWPNCVVPTTPPTPPAPQPPALSNPTNPEEIYANGETYPICITVSGKNGNSLTASFGSRYGSWQGGTTTMFTSQGVDRICKVYVAPRDTSVIGKNEQFTFNVHDNTTGLNGQEVKGLEFPVKAPPARP